MKKAWMGLGLLLLCACLSGCSGPANEPVSGGAPAVSAYTAAPQGREDTFALYFRLGDTEYLTPEQRYVTVPKDETVEMALVRSLLQGPAATSSALSPVFPAGSEVLAMTRQGDTLFVTLNEAALSGYGAERSELGGEEKKQAIAREKQLAMDALTATLTEEGLCSRVQVLVYRDQVQGNSMRLTEDDLLASGSLLPVAPFTRNEERLYTPHNAAKRLLSAWMSRDVQEALACVALQGRPADQTFLDELARSPALTGFTLSHGQVSVDGSRAVMTAELSLHHPEKDWEKKGFPLTLVREDGVWKVPYDTLCSMMTEE